jgi:hypothetical protein
MMRTRQILRDALWSAALLRRFLMSTINPQLSIVSINHAWTRMFTILSELSLFAADH